jgi:hypothetical protein
MTTLARSILELHDRLLLYLVQEGFYRFAFVSAVALFILLACLPPHRRVTRCIAWLSIAWIAACMACYGAFAESPRLAWFLLALIAYRAGRVLSWTVRSAGESNRTARHRLHPQSAWMAWCVRDYLRFDPRCAYWLDLARAVRGQPISRTSRDRASAVTCLPECPAWRRRIWQTVFRLVELRIGIYRLLPGWWHHPQDTLDLHEPDLRCILEEETRKAFERMQQSWTGQTMRDYYDRSRSTRLRMERWAAACGRKFILHREAFAEYCSLRQPWPPGDKQLVQVAWFCYATWQSRRQFDMLWHPDSKAEEQAKDPAASNDDPLFDEQPASASPAPAAKAMPSPEIVEVVLSPQQRERLADLQYASALLEAHLGLTPTPVFACNVEQAERLLADAGKQWAVVMLLMLYCLRPDFAGAEIDRQKTLLLHRLGEQFDVPTEANDPAAEARRTFKLMHLDVLSERGEFSQIMEFFGHRPEPTDLESKMLADAELAVIRYLPESEELSDILRYEAINHCFQAGFRGLWTREYVGKLIPKAASAEAIAELFRSHPVVLVAGGPMDPLDRPKPQVAPAPPSRAMQVLFYKVDNPATKFPYTVAQLPCVIGSSKQPGKVTKRVSAEDVAPEHVRIFLKDNRVMVQDVSNGSGMWVNLMPIEGESPLRAGDQVQFGCVVMEVVRL